MSALFGLVGEGVLRPTAQQVAERAAVGIRSVFRHFDDMEGLFAAMDERLKSEVLPLVRSPAGQAGSLRERADSLLARRIRFFERIAPYKRSSNTQRWRSSFLQGQHALLAREMRADLLRTLPELAEAPAEVVEALDLLSSFEAWERLRTDQRLSRERTAAALRAAVVAQLVGVSPAPSRL